MTKIGYARVSTREQNLARQTEQLKAAGVTKLFQEKLSGKNAARPQLQAMLDYLRDDDEVIVLSLDRLGRNSSDLTEIMEAIRHKGATLNVLNLPSFNSIEDTNLRNLITNIIIELYKYMAQEERETIKVRQRQGIEIAKKKGKFKGRQYKFKADDPRLKHAFDLFLNGLSDKEVEEQTGINSRTFRRYRARYNVTVDQKKSKKEME